jgi:hypothetical protein
MSVVISDSMKSKSFVVDPYGSARVSEKTTLSLNRYIASASDAIRS